MTKADLTEKTYMLSTFSKKESADIVDSVFELLKSTLEAGEDIKISGFGKFAIREKSTRNGRNPHTGKPLEIAARKIITYMPSKILKATMNS